MRTFTFNGEVRDSFTDWLTKGIKDSFEKEDFNYTDELEEDIQLVFNLTIKENPQPFRRKSQGTFVVSMIQTDVHPDNIFKEAYRYLVRTVSNHLMYIVHNQEETVIHFLTPEQGHYTLTYKEEDDPERFFKAIYDRLSPVATSQLVIDNSFEKDLPEKLWEGDQVTQSLREAGQKLDQLDLLPAPFPLEEVLSDRDIRHLKKLYGVGGLSYGNLSARKEDNDFWMSASGIDKGDMSEVGRDFLYISGYDEEENAMKVSVPSHVKPKRASMDAIEQWKIYTAHPEVGAIVLVHGWMEGIEATPFNYPCGTIELAESVAEIVDQAEDPSRTVVGLKNHGLTITGRSLEGIFEQIEGKIIPQVPME